MQNSERENATLLTALEMTAQIMQTELSDESITLMSADLSIYPMHDVLEALARTRREHPGKLTLQAVISRIDMNDGRPLPEEAWATVSFDEADTNIMTKEMEAAFWAAFNAHRSGASQSQARLVFIEKYNEELAAARAAQVPVRWVVSAGHNKQNLSHAISTALMEGRITPEIARHHARHEESGPPANKVVEQNIKKLLADMRINQ